MMKTILTVLAYFWLTVSAQAGVVNPVSNAPRTFTVQAPTQTALVSAMSACSTAGGGIVSVPPGTYAITSSISLSGFVGCTIAGSGRGATVLDCSALVGDCITSGTTLNRYTIRDLTIVGATSGGATPNAVKLRKTDRGVVLENVDFSLTTGTGVYCNGCVGARIRGGSMYSDGDFATTTEKPRGVYANESAVDLAIDDVKMDFLYDGVYLVGSASSPVRDVRLSNLRIEGGAWTGKARYVGSGATVSYGATTLVDSAAPFAASGVPIFNVIRALTVVGTGTITATSGGQFTDGAANFPASVMRGDLVRTATAFAVVEQRVSSTILATSEWRDLTTYRPVAVPVNTTAYTLYDVILGEVANGTNTTSTITVFRWYDFAGVTATPAAQTLYEVLWYRGGYAVKASANVNDVSITGSSFSRGPSAAIELSGSGSTVTGNLCRDGLDGCVGIQGGGRASITANVSDHQNFGVALYGSAALDGNRSVVDGNVIRDTHWANHGDPPTYASYPVVIRSSDENIISNNQIEKGSLVTGTVEYGIFIDDDPEGSGGNDSTNNRLDGNQVLGFDTSSIRLEDADAAGTMVNGLSATDSPWTCNAGASGTGYWDLSMGEACTCTGSAWVQRDGGGACS